MAEIASAHVTIYPKFASGFASGIKNEVGQVGTKAGVDFDDGFAKGAGGGKTGKSAAVFTGLKAGIAGIVASASIGAAVAGFTKLTGAASDLNETVNKSKVIFGDQYGAVETWAQGAAKSMGLSKSAALDAASGFGDMFSQLGFTSEAAASMSTEVVQMSADLGSFNNLPTADVTERIAAAFRGEYDSLQKVIPNINAARVETEALALSGKTNASELTAQEKATAVLAIVQADGARAMGDFARTSEDAANKQKTLTAQTEDLQARIGTLLAPVQALALEGFGKLIEVGETFTTWLESNPAIVDGFTAALSLAADILGALGSVIMAVAIPALAGLLTAFSWVLGGIESFLRALGSIPGFEWATEAADKVATIRVGTDAAVAGLNELTGQIWNATININTYGVPTLEYAVSLRNQLSAQGSTTQIAAGAYQGGATLADGGMVGGWSPHPRADNIFARLTAGEFVHPVPTVAHYGEAAMEAVRRRTAVISYGHGGLVGQQSVAVGAQFGGVDEAALGRAVATALAGMQIQLTGGNALADQMAARITMARRRF